MSQEDLSEHFQSDESDDEAKKLWSYGECDDDGSELHYWDLVCLHDNLVNFESIYINNATIDTEHYLETEGGQRSENDSIVTPMALIQDYADSADEALVSTSSSLDSPEAVANADTNDSQSSALSFLQDLGDHVQHMLASFSSTSSDLSVSDLQ